MLRIAEYVSQFLYTDSLLFSWLPLGRTEAALPAASLVIAAWFSLEASNDYRWGGDYHSCISLSNFFFKKNILLK